MSPLTHPPQKRGIVGKRGAVLILLFAARASPAGHPDRCRTSPHNWWRFVGQMLPRRRLSQRRQIIIKTNRNAGFAR
jgi:hypothetical protein